MTINRTPLALGLATALLLGACAPVTSYTDAEAPKNLTLDTSSTNVDLRFAPGSASLSPAEVAHLQRLAASRAIQDTDRVTVAASGTPALVDQRVGAISSVLVPYGISVGGVQLAGVPANHAVVQVTRTLVTTPKCPNWSKPPQPDFANQPASNFACATETNLGLMVASPTDLALAREGTGTEGEPATAAIRRYMTDKVTPLPSASGATPFSATTSPTTSNTPTSGSP